MITSHTSSCTSSQLCDRPFRGFDPVAPITACAASPNSSPIFST
ncbi:hypothetical protein [Streptomyces katrae]